MRRSVGFILVCVVASGFLGGCQSAPDASSRHGSSDTARMSEAPRSALSTELIPVEPPFPAPDLSLPAMEGDTFRLSDHNGDVVVLNVWATWCGPCRAEIPGFIRLQREFGAQGLTIVGVSVDREGAAVVRPYAERMAINYTLAVDDGSAARAYGPFRTIPKTYVIDRTGRVRYVAKGALAEVRLRRVVTELLAEVSP